MISRPISEDDLNAYVDERLDPRRQAEVAAYLDAHPEVAQRIAGFARDRAMLRSVLLPIGDEPVPPELNLMRLVEARRRSAIRFRQWAMAASVALLVGLGGATGWTLRGMSDAGQQEGIASLAREATDSFAVFGSDRMRPVELHAADAAQLTAWASARLGRPVGVPDLSAAGYRFMGGRLVATEHGPAVMFVYDDDHGTRLVLLTRSMTVDRDMPMREQARDGINGFAWAAKGMGYCLVGRADPLVLHPIANAVRRQMSGNA
ncbi:MAG TPA: anti-sigma factor [Rhodopila sp.]|uniref:anti-sigma factor family protein n=1 Tax=Rhodopila sp. TaxID=2480087 RepID=UPI002D0A0B0C|nr:anti-sigma factor [Rhodopila sp.]HVY18049.1 anti-sigma factor [Rhodopila sp.]